MTTEAEKINKDGVRNGAQLRRLDLNLLMIFAAIARHCKLSAAAAEMNLTKSAISHALTRLRDIFEDPLFVRAQGGVRPTPRAETLLPKIVAIIRLSNDALSINESFDTRNDSRHLRIGAIEYVEAILAPELVRICRQEAPNLKLSFVPVTRLDMIEFVAGHKVDVAIGSFIGDTKGIEVEPVGQDEYVVVRRPSANVGPITREVYLQSAHVSISSEKQPQRVIEGVMTAMGTARKISAFVPHYITAFGIVANTDCLLTTTRLLAEQMGKALDLEIHPFPFPHESQTISVLSLPLARHDPAVVWLREKCHEAASAVRSSSRG